MAFDYVPKTTRTRPTEHHYVSFGVNVSLFHKGLEQLASKHGLIIDDFRQTPSVSVDYGLPTTQVGMDANGVYPIVTPHMVSTGKLNISIELKSVQ